MGESTTVQCSFSVGDLPVHLKWLQNGIPVTPATGIDVVMVGKKVSVLTIDTILEHHSGNYTCVAENSAGSASYTAELIVNG